MATRGKSGGNKTGGRTAGTPNKITSDLRTWISELIDDNREQIVEDLKDLEPQQRVAIFEKLLQYVIPKRQQQEQAEAEKTKSEFIKRMFN